MAQDTEMVFAFPWKMSNEIRAGLEGTHRGGVRYPIPVAMRGTVSMPDRYRELFGLLERQEAGEG